MDALSMPHRIVLADLHFPLQVVTQDVPSLSVLASYRSPFAYVNTTFATSPRRVSVRRCVASTAARSRAASRLNSQVVIVDVASRVDLYHRRFPVCSFGE